MRKTKRATLVVFALLFLPWATAQAYIIGGPNAASQAGSSSYAWDGGVNVSSFRAALENPLNFGPGGVVPETIVTTDILPNAAGLAGVDGFISPWWRTADSNPYHSDIMDFFLGGGDLWLMQDSAGRDGVGAMLGLPTVGQTGITPVNGIAPLFSGPFGTATNVAQGGGEEGYLSTADVLALGGTVVGTNTEDQVIAAAWGAGEYAAGAGALIVVADIDMFTTLASFGPLNDNGVFALNAFAFLSTSDGPIDDGGPLPGPGIIDTPPTVDVPTPATSSLLALGLLMGLFRSRKLAALQE